MKKEFIKILGDRPVAYHPLIAKLKHGEERLGCSAAVFFSQLLYWSDKGSNPDGWIWKTQEEFESETGLTRWEQETARERLLKFGLLEEKRAGIPARMHYRIDSDKLAEKVHEYCLKQECGVATNKSVATLQTRVRNLRKQECGNTSNNNVVLPQSSYTESTAENTTENTHPPNPPQKSDDAARQGGGVASLSPVPEPTTQELEEPPTEELEEPVEIAPEEIPTDWDWEVPPDPPDADPFREDPFEPVQEPELTQTRKSVYRTEPIEPIPPRGRRGTEQSLQTPPDWEGYNTLTQPEQQAIRALGLYHSTLSGGRENPLRLLSVGELRQLLSGCRGPDIRSPAGYMISEAGNLLAKRALEGLPPPEKAAWQKTVDRCGGYVDPKTELRGIVEQAEGVSSATIAAYITEKDRWGTRWTADDVDRARPRKKEQVNV